MSGAKIDAVLAAIAALSEAERRELFSRLGVRPILARATQPTLFSEFAANTLTGPADYVIVFDGGSLGNPGRGYGSYVVITDDRREVKRLNFGEGMTNNEAEYATLLQALDDVQGRIERAARLPEEFTIEVRGDSALVLNQVAGDWKAKDERMRLMRDSVRRALQRFRANRLTPQPREATVKLLGH
ncbi:MAG TPA: ribonuclease HI family protein [Anaerolineae bacterium]|nr:ribonuclease HI family protein [Anaerolineae bacterium]